MEVETCLMFSMHAWDLGCTLHTTRRHDGGPEMLMMTTYRVKSFMPKEETKRMMDTFAEHGTTDGTIAHYVFASGGGGVVIGESDDLGSGYRNILNYGEWVDYEMTPLLSIDDALPHIMDALS